MSKQVGETGHNLSISPTTRRVSSLTLLLLALSVIHSVVCFQHTHIQKTKVTLDIFFLYPSNFSNLCVLGKYCFPSPIFQLLSTIISQLEFLRSYYFLFLAKIMEEYKPSQAHHTEKCWGQGMDKIVVKELMADIYSTLTLCQTHRCILGFNTKFAYSIIPLLYSRNASSSSQFSASLYSKEVQCLWSNAIVFTIAGFIFSMSFFPFSILGFYDEPIL